MKLIKIATSSRGGFFNFCLKLFLYVIEKKVLDSEISLFLLNSGPCYKKSMMKFKKSLREVFCTLITFNLSGESSLYHKKSGLRFFLKLGNSPKQKYARKRAQSVQQLNFSLWTNYDEILNLSSFSCLHIDI